MNARTPAPYQPDPAMLSLGESYYDPVAPADFPQTILRFRNQRWAAAVGLQSLSEADWLRHFGRFEPLPDNLPQPLALRYHGHQFRAYNPDIGDGRGFLFAQLRDRDGRLLDLGTKGSGTTPYSRFGDGRLTLKGGVREVLATEMLEALGTYTSKTFSLIETGEALERNDEPSPTRSAVLVRLSHGHIRIGTFQRLAYFNLQDEARQLAAYCLRQLYDEEPGEDATLRLFALLVDRAATLAASYIAAGFVHGVLNTDNIAITGESFDYGPWRFTPYWDGHFTAAYFDHAGLYSFGRQPEAIHWNLLQLALSLREIAPVEELGATLEKFPDLFQERLRFALFARLGIRTGEPAEDMELVTALETALAKKKVPIDRFFFDWRGGALRGDTLAASVYFDEEWAEFRTRITARTAVANSVGHEYWSDSQPCSLHIEEVEAIWSRIDEADDWALFHAKIAAIRRMGDALAVPAGKV